MTRRTSPLVLVRQCNTLMPVISVEYDPVLAPGHEAYKGMPRVIE
jgi:hypothetical protein